MSKINNWSLIHRRFELISPVETNVFRITGDYLKEDDDIAGLTLLTSPVVSYDSVNNTIQTMNTLYNLGTMSKTFEKYMKDNNLTIEDFFKK